MTAKLVPPAITDLLKNETLRWWGSECLTCVNATPDTMVCSNCGSRRRATAALHTRRRRLRPDGATVRAVLPAIRRRAEAATSPDFGGHWTAETSTGPAAPSPPPDDADHPAARLAVTCEYVPWPTRRPPFWSGRPPTTALADELAAIHAAHVAAYGPGAWTGGVGLPATDDDRDEADWVAPERTADLWAAADGGEWT